MSYKNSPRQSLTNRQTKQKQSPARLAREMLPHVAERQAQGASIPLFFGEVEAMNAKTGVSFGTRLLTAGAMLAMFALAPQARADVVRIHFSGAIGNGYADLTTGPARIDDVVNPGNVPVAITGAHGTFNGSAITGVRAIDHTTAPGEVLPWSYSLFAIPGVGDHNGVSYDNLFYPTGSPLICFVDGSLVYPFSGGLFDLMGVMFALDNGDYLDLWSFGNTAPNFFFDGWPGGLTYGMKLIQSDGNGGYFVDPNAVPFATVSVPEPNFLWLLGAAVLGLFAWRRSSEVRRKTSRID
jgi:hypothetical protein